MQNKNVTECNRNRRKRKKEIEIKDMKKHPNRKENQKKCVTDKDLALLPDAQDPKRRGLTSFWPTGKN
jgi:hypothetical protein